MYNVDYLHSAKEVLQENITDFDIMRERPLAFRAGGNFLICSPVKYYEHPAFIKDLIKMLMNYKDIFVKVSFLSSIDYKDQSAIQNAIDQITIFNETKMYKKFIQKAVPTFIKRWGKTIRQKDIKKFEAGKIDKIDYVKLTSRSAKKAIDNYSADELLYILMAIWVFNYDIVKKKCLFFMASLNLDTENTQEFIKLRESSTKSKPVVMPEFSMKPYSKETLKIFAKQSKMN